MASAGSRGQELAGHCGLRPRGADFDYTVPVRLLNPLTETVTVYAGMTLATLESVEPPLGALDVVSSGDPEMAVRVEKQELL